MFNIFLCMLQVSFRSHRCLTLDRLTGCPQVLHVYWYYLMVMIAVRKFTDGELEDTRDSEAALKTRFGRAPS